MVIRHLDTGAIDLAILDGEAVPVGMMQRQSLPSSSAEITSR
jgi:hypothetical protein